MIIWLYLVNNKHWENFFIMTEHEWIDFNMTQNMNQYDDKYWKETWALACH